MGKAPVDLPDPLEQPSSAPGAGADDLLSQLAGDEIDRLLAEAERSPGGPELRREETPVDESSDDDEEESVANEPHDPDLLAETSSLASMPAAEAVMDEIAETAADVSNQLDELVAQLDDKAPTTLKLDDSADAAVPKVASVNVDVQPEIVEKEVSAQELDQAIARAAPEVVDVDDAPGAAKAADAAPDAGGALDIPAASVAKPRVETTAEASETLSSATPASLASVVETETSAAERSLLDTALADPAGDSPEAADADLSDLDAIAAPVPIYLKPLVWLNAPFAALSESKRESLGKVAVVTMVNAVAVLLYVLIFRNH